MEYIEYMNNLRQAFKLIMSKAPEVRAAIEGRAKNHKDEDLKIMLKPDWAWNKLQEDYIEVEPKLYQFYPEEEFGAVHTMWAEDMKGDER